eukprot:1332391-Pleurochrysis_carterae.AAC.1
MVRELERVERELRERDRAELATLREQVAALTASQNQACAPTSLPDQHRSADGSFPPTIRVPSRTSIAVALN